MSKIKSEKEKTETSLILQQVILLLREVLVESTQSEEVKKHALTVLSHITTDITKSDCVKF